MRRRLRALCLTLAAFGGAALAAEDRYPDLAAAYLVEVGETTLWAGGQGRRLPPASLTKLMTALLVVEDYRPDEWVTVSPRAAAATGARVGLRAGTRLKVSDLLAATLVRSANDTCLALAEHYAGSETAFVVRMNRRAETLGLNDTRFANACGFDAPGHYSTVGDLAILARLAMQFPVFAELVKQRDVQIQDARGAHYTLRNTNALVGTYPGTLGIKSGFTNGAGRCIAALVERKGVQVLLIMLNAQDRWWDAVGVLEHAFDHAPAQR